MIGIFIDVAAPPKVDGVQVVGKDVEGNVIKGVGNYFGGNQGPSLFEWFRLDSNTKLVMHAYLLSHLKKYVLL